jgi:hypothetical protein
MSFLVLEAWSDPDAASIRVVRHVSAVIGRVNGGERCRIARVTQRGHKVTEMVTFL